MKGLYEYIPTYAQTQRGIVDIKDIVPGDKVYEYLTGKMLEVKESVQSECTDIYEITYNDNRVQHLGLNERMVTGNIDLLPLDFHPGIVKSSLYPDPYIAGALFGYGDFNNKYISLPADRKEVYNEFAHKYHVQLSTKSDDETAYFSFMDNPNKTITWKQFFPDYEFYAKNHRISAPPIPEEYTHAPISDRYQFIRGVFDTGYDDSRFKGTVSIQHSDENRLICIQEILWSLGVPSMIRYEPMYFDESMKPQQYENNRFYVLEICGGGEYHPGYFYNEDHLHNALKRNDRIFQFRHPCQIHIKMAVKLPSRFISNLVLEKPNAIYLTHNFLPRVSL